MSPPTIMAPPTRNRVVSLTPRETEILRLAADGYAAQEIAALLDMAARTVKTHFQRIFAKLGVHSAAAAVGVGLRQGLIT